MSAVEVPRGQARIEPDEPIFQRVVLKRSYQFEYAAIASTSSRIAMRTLRHIVGLGGGVRRDVKAANVWPTRGRRGNRRRR